MDALTVSQPAALRLIEAETSTDRLIIERWLHGKASTTQAAYARDLELFLAFVGRPLDQVTLRDLQEWQDELGVEVQQVSVRRKLAAVKSLLKFAHQSGLLSFDVGVALKLPKVRDTLADRIISDSDVQRMIRYEPGKRNRLMLRLLYTAALRVSELCSLEWRDLRRAKQGGVVNVFGKGSKSRTVWITAELFDALLAFRGTHKPSEPLFGSRQGGHLTTTRVWMIVREAAKRVGIEADVSPHFLRHAHATEALHNGAPIDLVSQTLGHSSAAVTSRYLHASPRESSAKYLPQGDE